MANYELMFIIDPSLSEEDKTSRIDNFKSIIEKHSAKIEKEEIIGEKKLAYKINKSTTGFYTIFRFRNELRRNQKHFKRNKLRKNYMEIYVHKKRSINSKETNLIFK